MEMLYWGIFFVHTLFFTILEANAYQRDASSRFANLLKGIVSINKRRFEVMKELARLQEYSLTKYHLRTGKDNFAVEEHKNSRRPLVVFIVERVLPKSDDSQQSLKFLEDDRSIDDSESFDLDTNEDDDEEQIQEGYINGKGILRKWKGCSKEAAKVCKKACRDAYKNVCASHSCRSRLKKDFKRECKSACKSRFGVSSYDYDE